jgi:hypothetical protein
LLCRQHCARTGLDNELLRYNHMDTHNSVDE